MGGGYVGVDIFFVISGFLMTAIIIRGLEAGNFSVLGFWKRRAKRICPALLVAVALFYIVGFLLLVNVKEFYEYNKEATSALAFISNFRFAKDEGYFAIDSMSKMLLHTWSLSVEWQFYVIYPLLLWALKRFFSFKVIKATVVFLFIASLISAYIFNAEKYYYMLYTRAWELLAGAMVFLFPLGALLNLSLNKKRLLEGLGLILILSIFLRSDNVVWSASVVLPSVIGTMLIISMAAERGILANGLCQYLGKISYSLYIYHWLVLSFCARINLADNLLVVGIVILLLSMASYHFIETSRKFGWKFFALYLAMVGVTIVTVDKHGFADRYAGLEVKSSTENSPDFYFGFNNDEHKADVVLIGDSHARQYWSYFVNNKINMAMFPSSGTYCYDDNHCRFSKPNFVDVINKKYGSIHNFVNERQRFIESFPENTPIMISQRWIQHFSDESEIWRVQSAHDEQLRKHPQSEVLDAGLGKLFNDNPKRHFYVLSSLFGSHTIYTVRECNLIKSYNKYLPKFLLDNLSCGELKLRYDDRYQNINVFFRNYLTKYKNVTFIDPNEALCQDGFCKIVTDNNEAIFWDDNHLSVQGAELVGSYLVKQIPLGR